MKREDVEQILKEVEKLLGNSEPISSAVELLFNLVETLLKDNDTLKAEAERLRKLLEDKKRNKPGGAKGTTKDHSSNKHRESETLPPLMRDRRSGKDLTINETIPCPVDVQVLPSDVIRYPDEQVVVQNVKIVPHNILFTREVFFSPSTKCRYRGKLPDGFDQGDFGPDLRALILSLKYCGNMSEPKIGEFLENFQIQVSSGSLSNILTKTVRQFEEVYDQIFQAGVTSTCYQQTDDTSARVGGKSWNTHILCNPYYTYFSTRPGKDRLSFLAFLQHTPNAQFLFDDQTLKLLAAEFGVPATWRKGIAELILARGGSFTLQTDQLQVWLTDVLKIPAKRLDPRLEISHAAAIRYYQAQQSVPVIDILVCDDAPQFKLTTQHIQLCWIHEGRNYKKLDPSVPRHQELLKQFVERFWQYYGWLQKYRQEPTTQRADELRTIFEELFCTKTGYEDLDKRISYTAKKKGLLTFLSYPECPLHNNASELGARVCARRRDVSLHSRNARGAHAMDVFTTIVQTCKKLGQSSYDFFKKRLSSQKSALDIPQMIRLAAC
jgi:regulator of replication initiation timing